MKNKFVSAMIAMMLLASMLSFAGTTVKAQTEEEPHVDLLAGKSIDVGDVLVWNDEDYLYVKYETTGDWYITEVHLHVATYLKEIPQSNGNPVPGKFTYGEKGLWTQEYEFDPIALNSWNPGTELYIAAHAKVMDVSCYNTAILYGLERSNGKIYEIDVLTGTSTEIYDNEPPPPEGSATPNGLAYDPVNNRFYYTNYQNSPFKLYFWDADTDTETVAGTISGQVAAADFWNGKYYYITGPPASDDLYEVTFGPDGTIASDTKLADIAGGAHGWTFNGDIAVKDGVVYGWGLCSASGHEYEFFTYDLVGGTFTWTKPSYQDSLQLAFGSNGVLYGHRSGEAGAFYEVDTATGAVTMVTPTPSPVHLYTDCASGKICEPRTETAWGAGTAFSGKNWATYFTYTVQEVLVDTFTVPATTGTPTFSNVVLEAGKVYKIEAVGTYYFRSYGDPSGYLADAEYALRNDYYGTGWTKGDAWPYSEPYNGLDLCEDAAFNIDWGPLDKTTHTYSILYTGEDSKISLFIKDNVYTDNSGYLTVNIYWVG